MADNFEIREIKDSEFIDVCHFHKKYYGARRPLEVWNWEYRDIHPGKSVLTVAKDGDKIVGTLGMIPIYLNIHGKKYLSAKSESKLIDINYRGKQLSPKLHDQSVKMGINNGISFIWGNTSFLKAIRKSKYQIYPDLMKWAVLPIKIETTKLAIESQKTSKMKSALFSVVIPLGCVYSSIRRFIKKNGFKNKANYELLKKTKSGNDVEMFFERLRRKYPTLIHIDQDETYINWRMYNNPRKKRITYFVYLKDSLVGYVYLTIYKNILEITDFTFENQEVGHFLLKNIMNYINQNRIGFVKYYGNAKNQLNQEVFKILRFYGFISIKRVDAFLIRNLVYPDENELNQIQDWYITPLWGEGV